jgi:hypothetical protein
MRAPGPHVEEQERIEPWRHRRHVALAVGQLQGSAKFTSPSPREIQHDRELAVFKGIRVNAKEILLPKRVHAVEGVGRKRQARDLLEEAGKRGVAPGGAELQKRDEVWTEAICRETPRHAPVPVEPIIFVCRIPFLFCGVMVDGVF